MAAERHLKSGPGARQPPEYLAVGRIVRPHGVRGAMKVEVFSDLLEGLQTPAKVYLGEEHEPAVLRSVRRHKRACLIEIEGVEDRDAAERWRGATLQLRFEDTEPLPEGEFYYWQILGLQVVTEAGERLGEIVRILETGANDVYVVRDDEGAEVLLPAIRPVILEVDLEGSRLLVALPPGLLPDLSS